MNKDESKKNSYDGFYARGGWRYNHWLEKRFLVKKIIKPLQFKKGMKLLELGCGMGIHSYLFSRLGFEVIGVDQSEEGIAFAKRNFPRTRFLNLDAQKLGPEFPPESFDIIFVRGMSWYHYELNGVNTNNVDVPARTRELFYFLKKGGLFILQVKTDFSGKRPEGDVHHNKYEDYLSLFRPLGKIVLVSDWKGNVLKSQTDAEKTRKNIIIATRK